MRLSVLTITFYIIHCNSLEANGAKILGIGWYPAVSHQATFVPIWQELARRGHQVTVITSVSVKNESLKNLKEIDVSFLSNILHKSSALEMFSKDKYAWQWVVTAKSLMLKLFEMLLASSEVQALIKSEESFDVIVAEPLSPLVFAFGERFKAPVVALSSLTVAFEMSDLYANPTHPLFSLDFTMAVDTSPNDHPFSVRVALFLFNIWERMLYHWYYLPESDKVARKYFGANIPYLGDICRKYSSILLTNVNPVTNPVRANVPCVIEINQIHIRENRSLPEDLQTFLDSSTNGAVYFSLGTHVLSSDLNNEILNEILQAFSELPFNVLLKSNGVKLPAVSPNVLVKNFFPQQDILAHSNLRVFVTQGGLQSIEEAIFKEVPMVGIPFIGDQHLNIKRLVDLGLAVRIQPSEITRDSLKNAIMEVAENKSFKETVRKYKSIMEDQPLRGVDKAVWWIEHVIRHKGAEHLRSPAVDMNFIKYLMLDVILFLLAIIICIYYSLSKLLSLIRNNTTLKPKKD